MCRLSTLFMLYPVPRQDFGGASLLFSGCTILSAFLAGRVSGEQRGGAAEILSQFGVDRGERTQSTHPPAVQKLWTIQKSYIFKYAIECIFIRVTLLNGRHLGFATDLVI